MAGSFERIVNDGGGVEAGQPRTQKYGEHQVFPQNAQDMIRASAVLLKLTNELVKLFLRQLKAENEKDRVVLDVYRQRLSQKELPGEYTFADFMR
ncbi:MAG: hypothetical protein NT019_00040 [Candidatus Adlerbacteria bacterium]|nr:hypothetical protein [Candidatus Adlerbacteria bacterium]